MSKNPKVKIEADRACASINSYGLKVFALTVNLGLQNLADIEDTKGDKKIDLSSDAADADFQLECITLIHAKAPDCSVLVISEGKNPMEEVRILAYSCNPALKANEWVNMAAMNMKGQIVHTSKIGVTKGTNPDSGFDVHEVVVKMNEANEKNEKASPIKEKDNALAASFGYLRAQGLSHDEESDDEPPFDLDSF